MTRPLTRPTASSPTTGIHLAVKDPEAAAPYFESLQWSLFEEGLLTAMAGKRGQVQLDSETAEALLKLPEVKADVGRFVREAFLGSSGIVFNFEGSEGLVPLARALGAAGEGETFDLLRREVHAYHGANAVQQLAVDHALLAAFQGDAAGASGFAPSGAQQIPFQPNASETFLPAIARADAYAKSLGFDALSYRGTGVMARGLEVNVNSIEFQQIVLHQNGTSVDLGQVLPEASHLVSLKSADTVFNEVKAMLDAYVARAAKPAGADAQTIDWR